MAVSAIIAIDHKEHNSKGNYMYFVKSHIENTK